MAAPEEEDFSKMPLKERIVHKVRCSNTLFTNTELTRHNLQAWKARVSGYEDAAKMFRMLDSPDAAEYKEYGNLIKKFVTDGNVVAQGKGVEAALEFVNNAAVAPKYAADIVDGIVDKCLNASKTSIKDKSEEICLALIAVCNSGDVISEALVRGFENKQPKIVAACTHVLTVALKAYGPRVVSPKPVLKVSFVYLDVSLA